MFFSEFAFPKTNMTIFTSLVDYIGVGQKHDIAEIALIHLFYPCQQQDWLAYSKIDKLYSRQVHFTKSSLDNSMAKKTIERFIWAFQRHFRTKAEFSARNLFQALDRRFEPKIFLVGVLANAIPGKHEACVEPENDFWAKSERFEGLGESIEKHIRENPESQLLHTHPRAQELADERLFMNSIKTVVEQTITGLEERPSNQSFFVSLPRQKGGYWVSTVLSLQSAIIDQYPRLNKSAVSVDDYHNIRVANSLIDACVIIFLDEMQEKLEQPRAGEGFDFLNVDYALNDAAALLMSGISTRVAIEEGNRDLFRVFNTVSSLQYEKAVGAGSYIIASEEHTAVRSGLKFSSRQSLGSDRASRKLLELASVQMPLHTNSGEVFGLCTVGEYDSEQENLFCVMVTGHQEWELRHAGSILMSVKFGRPALPSLDFDADKLRIDLSRLFPKINSGDISNLIALVRKAQQEPHGTMLLITDAAERESARLSTQATAVEPTTLTPELLSQLTTIDGAVVLSPNAICYAIGAILDGLACEEGDPARGARYNSAVRYVKSSDASCLAIVVSEDGGTDFLPDLPAPILREDVDRHLNTLKEISDEGVFSSSRFNEAREWIKRNKFYLLQKDCDLLNELLPKLEEMHYRGSVFRGASTSDYKQHPEMDSKFYYVEELNSPNSQSDM